MICVKEMSLKYPNAECDTLKKLSFDVNKGEIFGFLGPSGAGKSTLQKVLSGVLRGYSGNVSVLGTEAKNRTSDFYERIGVDFEFPNFYSKFTAIENLMYFSSLYSKKLRPIMPLLERVGLQSDVNKKISSYSKGMKMRLGFVRCLIHNPDLLFLDEPTSGLDPTNSRIVKDMILEEKQKGKTILLTTHNMHDAEELCDKVAFIVDGKIATLDTPRALQSSGAGTYVYFTYHKNGELCQKSSLLCELNIDIDFMTALKNGNIQNIHSKEKTLEDVFIELTGRCLQ